MMKKRKMNRAKTIVLQEVSMYNLLISILTKGTWKKLPLLKIM